MSIADDAYACLKVIRLALSASPGVRINVEHIRATSTEEFEFGMLRNWSSNPQLGYLMDPYWTSTKMHAASKSHI